MPRAVAALALLALALAGCSGGGDDHGSSVALRNNAFDPSSLTVDAGTEVHFEVEQGSHTVTVHKAGDAPSTLLHDETVGAGDDAHFTFGSPGTYHVWCKFHGTMTTGMAMVVTVE